MTLIIRSTILAQMEAIATDQKKRLAPLTDELLLANSGLDSLGFAVLVSRLEDELGCDPFTESENVYFPVTFGDFVRLYEAAMEQRQAVPQLAR
jgi:acyl carrier protein